MEESKGESSSTKSIPTTKRVVIGEKRLMNEVSHISLSKARSKGKEALPLPMAKKAKSSATSMVLATKGARPAVAPWEGTSANPSNALGPGASMLRSPSIAEKILSEVILPIDKVKVDKFSLDQVVTKFFHIVGKLEGHLAEFSKWEKKAAKEIKAKTDAAARLE
ncbi:hypothetical protein Acr_00g0042280 [Actinidia rufa]|uniref:Uncharacterized protein n=1 Tax=Actinidia rufa TaxID=165716 RepID=A0A7J0DIP1_9ERIC|nr:hypothetical protein Acr_00g0042280 [Actinidia rufa]